MNCPASLEHHWQATQTHLTEDGARHGLDWPALWQSLSEEQQARACKVLTISQYVAEALPREPQWFARALASDAMAEPLTRGTISHWLDELAADADSEDDWHRALRILRRRCMVHIIWRDILRLAPTMETTRALSDLADECVVRSIAFLGEQLQQRYGKPMAKVAGNEHSQEEDEEQQLHVLGMGKLGAYELNLSSDIDLIFAYPQSGNTTGPKVVTNQEYFIKLGQKLSLLI